MRFPPPPLLFPGCLALLALALLGGCHAKTPPAAPTPQQTMPSTDLAELGRLIRLPISPRAATFEKVTLGRGGAFGPTDWELIAVLEYEPDAFERLALQPPEQGPQDALTFSKEEVRPWFPPALMGALRAAKGTDSYCTGEGYDAGPFAKSPLLQGVVAVPRGTHYVVLRLQTS